MKMVFVILNYNTYTETVECVNSIEEKIDIDDYRIVIIDNGSKDDSPEKLKSEYLGSQKIELIETQGNLGFARGNNVGIKYANEHYAPDFMVVLNSDTELIQNDFYEKVSHEYDNSEFALLGPLILLADGRCDNSPHFPPTYEYVSKELKSYERERKIISAGLYRPYCGVRYFKNLFDYKVLRKTRSIHRNMEFHLYQRQVVLQGCFVVFSKKAFKFVDGFMPDTFLYYEEPILYLGLMKHGLVTVYDPEICIYHKDGRATGTVSKKSKDKLLFINQCYQDSARELLKRLKKDNE